MREAAYHSNARHGITPSTDVAINTTNSTAWLYAQRTSQRFLCSWQPLTKLGLSTCMSVIAVFQRPVKYTLQFKPLYLLKYIRSFNDICRRCCANSRT